ncbi:MAG: CPBP family intramembrane metalloprotease [Bacteroidetes bacterium]|nr:CPBP family intramembrane metalloprotease [Bacteroidota bacterium]
MNAYFIPALVTILIVVAFLAYYFTVFSKRINSALANRFGETNGNVIAIVFQRMVGITFFAVIPIMVIVFWLKNHSLSLDYFFPYINPTLTPWILGFPVVILAINLFVSKKEDNYKRYPQMRAPEWGVGLILLNAVTWGVYVLAYEFLFRGFLLGSMVEVTNVYVAVGFNIILYATVHIPKGKKEVIASLPGGIIWCALTLATGSIWACFFAHWFFAISNDYVAIYANPQMRYNFRKF